MFTFILLLAACGTPEIKLDTADTGMDTGTAPDTDTALPDTDTAETAAPCEVWLPEIIRLAPPLAVSAGVQIPACAGPLSITCSDPSVIGMVTDIGVRVTLTEAYPPTLDAVCTVEGEFGEGDIRVTYG